MPSQRKPNAPLDELRAERLRELKLRCSKLERELAHADRQVAKITEIDDLLLHLGSKTHATLRFRLESELPPKCVGQPVEVVRELAREAADAVANDLRDAVADWSKEHKPCKPAKPSRRRR